jgi:SET domain
MVEKSDASAVTSNEPRRKPLLYLGRSSNGEGWGVFSSQNISRGEIIELAPLLLRFPEEEPEVLKGTILNNYHYEYWAWNGVTTESQFVLSFGYMLYFNHSSQPNIKYQQFGKEPDIDNPGNAVGLGYYALCDVPAHVELLCDYGGPGWFQDRGVTLVDVPKDQPLTTRSLKKHHLDSTNESVRMDRSDTDLILSSNVYSGYNSRTVQKVAECHSDAECDPFPYNLDSMKSCLFSIEDQSLQSGFGSVICREDVEEGATLEVVPVLVLFKSAVMGTLLETIVMDWKDLEYSHSVVPGNVVKVTISEDAENDQNTPPVRCSTKIAGMDETVLLALAGNLSLLWRSMTEFNSRLVVDQDEYNDSGFLLRLVATSQIRTGEIVVVKMPSFSPASIERMVEELALTGQPVVPDLISEE